MVLGDETRLAQVLQSVRVSITDGPFAETSEQIGGAFDRCGSKSDSSERPH